MSDPPSKISSTPTASQKDSLERKLKVNVSRRAMLFQRVQHAFDLIKNISDPKVICEFRTRCRDLDQTRQEFSNLVDDINEIELTLNPKKTIDTQTASAFDDLYYQCISTLDTLNINTTSSNTNKPLHDFVKDTVKLPRIPLRKFNGSVVEFIPWYNLFCSVINNSNIPDVQKLLYLLASLEDEPLNLIKHLPTTDANYQVAINILLARYNSKRKLASSYVEKLLSMEPLKTDSYNKLRTFHENLAEQYFALEALKIPDLADFILFHITFRNLDPVTRRNFESQVNKEVCPEVDTSVPLPTFKQLLDFLSNQCKILESSYLASSHVASQRSLSNNQRNSSDFKNKFERGTHSYKRADNKSKPLCQGVYVATAEQSKHSKNSTLVCPYCQESHTLYVCPQFRSLSVVQRKDKVRALERCYNCLGNHLVSKCSSKSKCLKCNSSRHHSLLCNYNSDRNTTSSEPQMSAGPSTSNNPELFSSVAQSPQPTVLLGTARIHVKDISGAFVEARVLIDSGSQSSFLSKSFFNKLGLPYKKSDITVTGLGQTSVTQRKGIGSIVIKPRTSSSPLLSTQVVILDQLAGPLPSCELSKNVYEHYKHLPLADPYFFKSALLDGIIGAELFPLICPGSPQSGGPGLPSAIPSIFGWIIMGSVSPPLKLHALFSEVSLDESLKKFWEIEQPPSKSIIDPEYDECEELFNNHTRDSDGRYVVPLLLKNNCDKLGGSYGHALKCLMSTERRLAKNSTLKESYHQFMKDYEQTGHMKKIYLDSPMTSYFIPHHAVFNPQSTSTKMRIVFNGSAPSSSGLSLNEILHTGPKLQLNIIDVIHKFRFHAVAFTTDIRKMYRQIKVLPSETKYQRILWRYSPNEPVSIYELKVVTWGLRSSPYLACRTLKQLALDEAGSLPRVAEIINEETYIDDLISGAPNVELALQLQSQLISVFKKGGFELCKWSSNHKSLLSNVAPDNIQNPLVFDNNEANNHTKVLGLQWNSASDDFSYRITPFPPRFTKREILSDISKLYDPMGWLSPVILEAKKLIQKLWLSGVEWDEVIPADLQEKWNTFVMNFNSLSRIKIPRFFLHDGALEYSILGFSDASEKGYAAVLYLHVSTPGIPAKIYIIMAKSKVAPIKPLSIPRLELCGALLLSQLIKTCLPLFTSKLSIKEILAFTDSTVVLAWLKTPPHLLKQFVANRIVEITSTLCPSQWFHVDSKDNPADCASRGIMPDEIATHPLWFKGPPWLASKPDWPITLTDNPLPEIPELKRTQETFLAVNQERSENFMFFRYSSFQQMIRITAWILRAFRNFKYSSSQRSYGPLTCQELKNSLHRLVKIVQQEHFADEIDRIRKDISKLEAQMNSSSSVSPQPNSMDLVVGNRRKKRNKYSSCISSLSPFLDLEGLLRVGGRLRHADLPYDMKHPLLLPKSSTFTHLLIDHYHVINLHVGPRALHSILQRRFWILSGRQAIRSRLVRCLPCLKMRTQCIQPRMGDLPLTRIQQARPFQIVGTDFGGPFLIRESSFRKSRTSKAYLCLFVCFSTKAVHLEVVSDLSSDAFLAAFDRFTSRRGRCSTVFSDCGTNYVGANSYLTDLHRIIQNPNTNEQILNHLANQSITWKFSPPSAPHFGGVWEAGIKSAKHTLRRVVGERPLTFEQLATIFTKVEAVLNSRPLCPISSDPSDLEALTPGHFLIGCPLTALPELDLSDVPQNRLTQWQLLRQISQSFWNRWRNEYLSTLTQRQKWTNSVPNIREGDLVLLRDNKSLPLCWRLGRVEKVHPGQDGTVRVVTLRCAQGELRRPVVKLVPLPRA